MKPKIYCISMWKSVHIDVDGYLTPCCIHIHDIDKKRRIEDVDNIETVLIEDFEQWRQQMINGEWPEGCNQCKFAEEEGRSSKRLQDLHSINYLMTSPENVALEYLQLKTGSICNLRCTICCPACSSTVSSYRLKTGDISKELFDQYKKDIEWASDLNQYKKMDSKNGYYRIDIAGGEPLLNKIHFKWLDSLPNPEKTQLLYNTNGTQKPTREEIDIWKKFKGVWLAFSIDSYEEKFEKLRIGAKWDQVLSNLKYIQEEIIQKEFNLNTSNTSIVMTIHKDNACDMFDLYEKLTEHIHFTNPDPINFNYLYYPEHLALHNMPTEKIRNVIETYDKNIHRLPENSKMRNEVENIKRSLISFLPGKTIQHSRPSGDDFRLEL